MLSKISKTILILGFGFPIVIFSWAFDAYAGPAPKCASANCTDPKGCVELRGGEAVKIATFVPETGENASLAVDVKRGMELGLHTLNTNKNAIAGNKMNFLGHPVSFMSFDSGCGDIDTATLRSTADSIVSDSKTLFTMGTFCSGDALRTLDIFTDAGLILISAANTNPNLTDPAITEPPSFYARLSYNDKVQGQVMANFVNSTLGADSAATVDDGGAYGVGLTIAFRANFVGTLAPVKSLSNQTPGQIASDLAANPPDVIFFAGNLSSDAIALITAIRANNAFANTALTFGDSQSGSDFLAGGNVVEGTYVSTADVSAVTDPEFYTGKFLPTYERKYGESPPVPYHIFAYDIPHVMAHAAEQVVCRAPGGTDRIGREALYNKLLETTDFQGLAATYTCNSSGDCDPDPVIAILKVQNGQFVKQ